MKLFNKPVVTPTKDSTAVFIEAIEERIEQLYFDIIVSRQDYVIILREWEDGCGRLDYPAFKVTSWSWFNGNDSLVLFIGRNEDWEIAASKGDSRDITGMWD